MLKFYETKEKMQTMSAELTWSHYVEILPLKDANVKNYYINISVSQNLSVRELRSRIKSKE